MKKIALAIHGGAKSDSEFIRTHLSEYEDGLKQALLKGYAILKKGGHALKAVEVSTVALEDNPLFNAGRGSVLNKEGQVEMDAAIMDGEKMKAGAVSMIKNVRNPISFARFIMAKTPHVLLSDKAALKFAQDEHIPLAPDSYFITDQQVEEFEKRADKKKLQKTLEKKVHGTVGAVALDKKGNLAAAASTGGTEDSLPGRIGDSCIIGAGCYANNKTCAVVSTGEGEALIISVLAHSISSLIEYKNLKIEEACDFAINKKYKNLGEMGALGLDPNGNIGMACNTEVFMRACIYTDGEELIRIYK